MAILRIKDIRAMTSQERESKLKDLKLELIKAQVTSMKSKSKPKELRRTIARLLTINKTTQEDTKKN
ncbi:MAG: 50S ribosomal protein L29 [Nanoarchaeota archaeon]